MKHRTLESKKSVITNRKVNSPKDYSYQKIKRKINVFTLIFSAILIFDMLLGVKISEEKIEHKTYYKQQTGTIKSRSTKTVIGMITNKREYPFREPSLYDITRKGDRVEIYKSKILGEVTKIRFKETTYRNSVFSIYAFYYLFPIICIASSLGAFILGKTQNGYFDFFLVLSSILTVYLLLSMLTNTII